MQGKTLKKICALICGVVLCGSAIPCLSASAETTSDGYQQETYYEYKPGNSNPVKEYTLDTRPPAIATISEVIPDNDPTQRKFLMPLDQKIVNIGYAGTGAIIGDNAILTCAHTFIGNGGKFLGVSGVQIVNSFVSNTDDESSRKKLVITGFHVPKAYIDFKKATTKEERDKLDGHDYAIITVKIDNGDGTYSDLSEYGHFDMGIPLNSLNNKSDALKTVRVSGFFYDGTIKPHITYAMLKTSTGKVKNVKDVILEHSAITAGGTSGAPVYMEKTYNGNDYQTIIGVHTGHETSVKINKMILKFALDNSNIENDFN